MILCHYLELSHKPCPSISKIEDTTASLLFCPREGLSQVCHCAPRQHLPNSRLYKAALSTSVLSNNTSHVLCNCFLDKTFAASAYQSFCLPLCPHTSDMTQLGACPPGNGQQPGVNSPGLDTNQGPRSRRCSIASAFQSSTAKVASSASPKPRRSRSNTPVSAALTISNGSQFRCISTHSVSSTHKPSHFVTLNIFKTSSK